MCQGWPTATPNDLIPEFYSNFLNINTTTLEFDVFLRKKKYHISPDVVATALNIPRVDQLGYPFIDQLVPLRDNMMELFCGKPTAWGTKKSNPTTEFTCEARIFNLVMSHNLLPVSHRNTLELRRAQFLYALMTGVTIDLPSVICNSFITMHHSKDASLSLIHPCAITRILTHLNMNFPAAIPLVPRSGKPINRHSATRIATQMQKQKQKKKKRAREADNDEEDDAAGPSSVADARDELKGIVSYLHRISSQMDAQQVLLRKLSTRMRRVEQRAIGSSSGAAGTASASSTDGTEADGSEPDAAVEGDHYDKNDDIDDDDEEDEDEDEDEDEEEDEDEDEDEEDEEDEHDEHGNPK
uniref:Putative plant transposon protein domain-containing protein n=1 Tax=Fagus sylvatica TaxID=28930 RepID=A0A2N9GG56_FAGSY